MRGLAALLASALRTSIGVIPGMHFLDRVAGLVLGLVAGVFLCWAIGAVLLYLPGETDLRRSVQCSLILSEINDVVPPERLLEELERVDPIGVFLGPPAIVAPPEKGIATDPDVVRAAKSVVRVTGIACGLGVEGSGWVARPGLVVTNAHVVAGIQKPRVDLPDGNAFASSVVAFDATNDLAVLRVPGLRLPALALATPERSIRGGARRLPAERPADADARAPRRDRRRHRRGALGRGPVTAADDDDPGACGPAARAARGSTPGPRADDGVRASPGETGGYGIPSTSYARCSRRPAGGRSARPTARPSRTGRERRAAAGTAG